MTQLFDVKILSPVSGKIRKSDGYLVNRLLGYTIPARRLRTWAQLTEKQRAIIRENLERAAHERIAWAIAKDPTLEGHRQAWVEGIPYEVERTIKKYSRA